MGNYLKMADRRRMEALLESGWSYRRIQRETRVDRETVARYDRGGIQNPPRCPPALRQMPPGCPSAHRAPVSPTARLLKCSKEKDQCSRYPTELNLICAARITAVGGVHRLNITSA